MWARIKNQAQFTPDEHSWANVKGPNVTMNFLQCAKMCLSYLLC